METDDIRRIVETWSTTSRHWAPKEKDAEFLSKYLLQSVDRSKATDIVIESYCCYELVVSAFRVILRFFFWGDSDSRSRNLVSSTYVQPEYTVRQLTLFWYHSVRQEENFYVMDVLYHQTLLVQTHLCATRSRR